MSKNSQVKFRPTRYTTTDGRNVQRVVTDDWEQHKPIPPVKSDMIWFYASHKEKELKRSTVFATETRHFHQDWHPLWNSAQVKQKIAVLPKGFA